MVSITGNLDTSSTSSGTAGIIIPQAPVVVSAENQQSLGGEPLASHVKKLEPVQASDMKSTAFT